MRFYLDVSALLAPSPPTRRACRVFAFAFHFSPVHREKPPAKKSSHAISVSITQTFISHRNNARGRPGELAAPNDGSSAPRILSILSVSSQSCCSIFSFCFVVFFFNSYFIFLHFLSFLFVFFFFRSPRFLPISPAVLFPANLSNRPELLGEAMFLLKFIAELVSFVIQLATSPQPSGLNLRPVYLSADAHGRCLCRPDRKCLHPLSTLLE